MDGHCVATVARLVAIVLMSRSSFHVSRFLSISWGMQRSNKHSQQSNAITCTCLTDWILIHYLGNVHLHQFFQENIKMPGVLLLTSDTLLFVCLIWGLDALDRVNNPIRYLNLSDCLNPHSLLRQRTLVLCYYEIKIRCTSYIVLPWSLGS